MPQQTPQPTEDFDGMNKKTRYNNNSQQQQNRNAAHGIVERFALERAQPPRDSVNYGCRVDGAAHGGAADSRSVKTPTSEPARASPPVYENVQFDLRLSQQRLLQQFFRHSRAKSDAIYENLCRGCGYGVFEARGQLCNFCACIVNGLKRCQLTAEVPAVDATAGSTENIYENICAKCGSLYSSDDCEHCLTQAQVADDKPPAPPLPPVKCEVKQVANLGKSTSFGKRDKRSLFYGLIGSLKRSVKTPPNTPPQQRTPTRKHLRIEHNVDGFENVFRTQDTFDLQRICELKSLHLAKNSRSDQHIYGRLKCSDVLADGAQTLTPGLTQSQSHDQLLLSASSADSLLGAGVPQQHEPERSVAASRAKNAASANKRPRISKPRLLRSRSQNDTNKPSNNSASTTPGPPAKLSLYLADSVCQWLTSLRREVHGYRTHGSPLDDDQLGLCQPKSVPAKNPLIYCATIASSGLLAPSVAPSLTNNSSNADKPPAIKTTPTTTTTEAKINIATVDCDSGAEEQPPRESAADVGSAISPVIARMVRDFKRNLMAKQMQQQKQRPADLVPSTANAATSTSTAAAPQSPGSPRSQQQRAKRQAIYLKIDNNNRDPHNHNDANVNCAPIRNRTAAAAAAAAATTTATPFIDETSAAAAAAAAELCAIGEHGLAASRSAARQAITATDKRRGIYERDSEFVSDILSAFDHFLQRESDPNAPVNTPDESWREGDGEQRKPPTDITAEATSGERDHVPAHSGRNGETVTAYQRHDEDVAAITAVIDDAPATNSNDRRSACRQPAATQHISTVAIAEWRVSAACAPEAIAQRVDIGQLLNGLLIARGLNNVVIYYDKPLRFYLHRVRRSVASGRSLTRERLVRQFRRFYAHLQREFNSSRAPERSANLALVQSGDISPSSSVAVVGESVEPRSAPRNGSARVGVESAEAAPRRASAQIVVKRVSLIEADAGREVVGLGEVRVDPAGPSDGVGCDDGNSRSGGVMKSNSDEVVLRPKAKDASRRNEKALGKFIESVDDVQVRELSEPKRHSKCDQLAAEANAICVAGEATTTRVTERSPSGSPRNCNRAPQVPARDPKTSLSSTTKTEAPRENNSPPLPAKSESRLKNPKNSGSTMTVPTAAAADSQLSAKPTHSNNNNHNNSSSKKNGQLQRDAESDDEEEDIYQPIWQFKTVGEVQERYQTDADYYDVSSLAAITATAAAAKSLRCNDSSLLLPSVLISDNVEDHGEWETDDEFMFSTQPVDCGSETMRSDDDGYSLNSGTMRSTGSAASRAASASASGSTVTGFESSSSTATLASAISASLQHPLLRGVGIFYSLLEPKLRAIVYDYDRVHAPLYFAKRTAELASAADDSGIGRSPQERSPQPPPRTTSAARSAAPKMQLLPDSVQAWKFMLLDVNYLEDEEDMIVSEEEILRAQQIKEDIDTQAAIAATPQQNILQRFKSASFGNLIDLPNEDDKKSIAERMRNKLQRGVFKLNVRSPKSEKKSRGIFRRTETASLYLEDGMKPKYPIFGAPLEQLELNRTTHPHVPRLVVDCVEYIERKDCILQDGLYRASGNKISIDELKQKLSESYIYDPKLLATDDIHTLTSLLKLFFRELGAPLIPQPTYERFGPNVTDAAGIEALRLAIDQMPEPNRSTLQFLVRHLKNVAACSTENRMPASNLAIVWGPCIFSANQLNFVDIGRMNTLAKVLIENYERIFGENERLVS